MLDEAAETVENRFKSKMNMAGLLQQLGENEPACKAYAEIVKERKRVVGSVHIETLTATHCLATMQQLLGRRDEARETLKGLVNGYLKLQGGTECVRCSTRPNGRCLRMACTTRGLWLVTCGPVPRAAVVNVV